MAGPSVAWDAPTLDEIITGPLSAALMAKLRGNQEHLKEIADGGSGYSGGVAHVHDGTDSAAVDVTVEENLMLGGCPGKKARSDVWTLSGFRAAQDYQSNTGTMGGGYAAGHYMAQIIGGTDSGQSVGMTGIGSPDGMDCVVSFFIRPAGDVPTAGELKFGFSDNSTVTFSQSATVLYTDVASNWTRVYARFTAAGSGHSTNTRFLLSVPTTAFSYGIIVTGFQLSRGRHLTPWTISYMEGQYPKHGNVAYSDMPNCPLLDQRVAMDEAVDVTP